MRLLGHPVHAVLVHAPMGLLGTAPLWDAIGAARGDPVFFAVAFWTATAGVVLGVLAAVPGFADFSALEEGSPAERTALRHMILVLAAVSVFGVGLVFRRGAEGPSPIPTLACDALGLLALAAGGWHGGELVHRHGVGRPEARP